MAYESMHNVFVGMISFMTVGGVCNFFLNFFFMLLYESVIIQKVRDITDWWISDQALHCVLNHVFHVSILYTKANRRWNCTVFQPWCNDCSLCFCFVFIVTVWINQNVVDVTEKPFFGQGEIALLPNSSKIVEFMNLVRLLFEWMFVFIHQQYVESTLVSTWCSRS